MVDSLLAGEIMKRAEMLIKTKGQDALEYSNTVFESMMKTGGDEDRIYWHRIVRQIEVIVEDNPPR